MIPEAHRRLFKRIFKDIVFSPSEIVLLGKAFKKIDVKKGEVLLSVGQEVNAQYYVDSGCLRSFSTNETGKDYTFMFGISDWWICDYTAYFTDTRAVISIECLQDAIIYSLSKEDLHILYEKIPKVESFFRRKLERAFASFQRRIIANISQTATERYLSFIDTYPQIEQIVKNYHIASYLGITTESLSRIRK